MSNYARDFKRGEVLNDRWRIERTLGEGNFGAVYEASYVGAPGWFTPGDRVAVKVLHHVWADDPVSFASKRFKREGSLSRQAGGAAPAVYEYGEWSQMSESPYYVMELLEGETLEQLLLRQKLSVHETASVLAQVLSALRVMHSYGTVHRDIKPANLFVTKDGEVKLLDFGIAHVATDPELPRRSTVIHGDDPRSDLWAVGAVGYETLTGQSPERDQQNDPTSDPICPVPPVRALAPNVPEHIAYAIDKALLCDPSNRYQTAEEMLGDLR